MTVAEVCAALEEISPARWALDFDRVGLQVGRASAAVTRCLVALDWSAELAEAAVGINAQMVITHHPLLFRPLAAATDSSMVGSFLLSLAESGIAYAAAHTNWDAAPGGINDTLAAILGLRRVRRFGSAAEVAYLKVVVFAPVDREQDLVSAMAKAGAGTIGDYGECAFRSTGVGSFNPGPNAEPAEISPVNESRIEMRLPLSCRKEVERALREAHPYEEPAYDFYPVTPELEMPLGRLGHLDSPLSLTELANFIESRLETKVLAWGSEGPIENVAVVGGAADGDWRDAQQAGADAFVTGEVRQHVAVEAAEAGMAILAAGHFATENPGCRALAAALQAKLNGVEVLFWEPERGKSGRPL